MGRKAKTQMPTIIENLGDLNDVLMLSGQSTPAHGSFHNLPIPPATPTISSKSALHAQHILARVCETLVMTIKSLTRLRLLKLEPKGRLMEREEQTQLPTMIGTLGDSDLSMSSGQSTPAHGSFHNLPIPPATPTISSKSALHAQHILGHVCETSTSHIRLTSEAEFDRLCSNNETDGRALSCFLKREAQTQQQRAYRNQPRLWAPSRIRFTSEAEFDWLCSNDQPDGRPLKRETQTQQRAYRNQPRPWAPSRIRFTSEAEFDRLCSNDQPEGLL